MLTDFHHYNQAMQAFERSKLFHEKYEALLHHLVVHEKPILPSSELEELLKLKGSEIRRLVNHARKKGIPVGSSNEGYFMAKSDEELAGTISHMEERAGEMLFVVSKMKRAFSSMGQGSLNL